MRFAEYPHNSGMATAKDSGTPTIATESMIGREASPALKEEGRLLLKMGIGKPTIARALQLAISHGTTIEDELLASGALDEASYFEALSEQLGLTFLKNVDLTTVNDGRLGWTRNSANRKPCCSSRPSPGRFRSWHHGFHRLKS
ncbi:putative ubiquitin-RnfH superfamily antitoxin RatB of RatAB toxin-antitoxin module [Pararhizobium capsulatum DSM 1112]|uniref:Ubiquitin-RnfH superfamily antitoxin RatB of RatAB toxin-antitoxin module n=1 Tax=Pararhizobium capsulatum DSM 1112 TaxID=1121113 RepID=A0ABU0BKS9_9HYPH|nr:hypothetical protein [Pararhizobium capsulatum]MDQ0318852.1 putative ubiquitin-RnfH superfamily antitoxin RatB of RatAB toxin-antitoxin module [Pararhizobium capsulatum DSM 1112]